MHVFDDKMRRARAVSDRKTATFRQRLAEIADRQGRLVGDVVAPSISTVMQQMLGCSGLPQMEGLYIRRSLPGGLHQAYDIIAMHDDYLLLNDTRSCLQSEDITALLTKLGQARGFFPEYAPGKHIVGALAALYSDPPLVMQGAQQGLIMLGVVDGQIKIFNTADFVPKLF